jgi:sec-independent protein translocase protein TatB
VLDNLNPWELGALVLLALLIFGERLPKVIGDGMKMLRGLRAMAQNATADLNRELGTDLQVQDLHPKAFIRKHLLSEEDEDAIRKPLQSLFDDVKQDLNGVRADLDDVASAADLRASRDHIGPGGGTGDGAAPARHSFDVDAT